MNNYIVFILLFSGFSLHNCCAMENTEKQSQKTDEIFYYQFISADGNKFKVVPSICNLSPIFASMVSKENQNEPKPLNFDQLTLMYFFQLLSIKKSVGEQNLTKEKTVEKLMEKMKTTDNLDKQLLNVLRAAEAYQIPEIKTACIKHLIILLKNEVITPEVQIQKKNEYLIKGLQALYHGKKIEYDFEIINELTSHVDSLPSSDKITKLFDCDQKQLLIFRLLEQMKKSSNNPNGFNSLDNQSFENFENEFTEEQKKEIINHFKKIKIQEIK